MLLFLFLKKKQKKHPASSLKLEAHIPHGKHVNDKNISFTLEGIKKNRKQNGKGPFNKTADKGTFFPIFVCLLLHDYMVSFNAIKQYRSIVHAERE